MRRQDFAFDLPEHLIAHYPPENRSDCRLLHLDGTGSIQHLQFAAVKQLLSPGDLLVLNNTRVIPARLFASKPSGGRVEIMLERLCDEAEFIAQLRANKKLTIGTELRVYATAGAVEPPVASLTITGREEGFFRLRLNSGGSPGALFDTAGHMPLPPYIKRPDENLDRERYQTVYAQRSGAVAAPTAGLHFSRELLEEIQASGVATEFVTLHVGAGTFQPIRVDDIRDHRMHAEYLQVEQSVCDAITRTWSRGGRVVAVGSTSVRALETAAQSNRLQPFEGESELFIYPGYRFRTVDVMITNFHLSESSLLMMVCALAGRTPVLAAYQEAVKREYQFFSYGDAMFIESPQTPSLRQVVVEGR